jgi:hypothetical protein
MKYNIAIDADSLVYKACHRSQDKDGTNFDIENAYFEFCGEIAKIKSELFSRGLDDNIGLYRYERGDEVNAVICLSPRKSFRNDISPSGVMFRENKKGELVDCGYKANRKPNKVQGIRELKKLILQRIPDICRIHPKAEADDYVNWLAREHNYLVAAIDKDVINANPTYCFDYNSRTWNTPRSQQQIEQWYLKQTLMGDSTDNIQGAVGVGAKTANTIIDIELNGQATLDDLEQYFDSRVELEVNHMLVRMDRFDGERILPWNS